MIREQLTAGTVEGGEGGAGVVAKLVGSLLEATPDTEALVSGFVDDTSREALTALLIALGALLAVTIIVHLIVRHVIIRVVNAMIRRSRSWWGETIIDHRVLERLALIVPLVILHRGIVFVPGLAEPLSGFVQRLCVAVIVLMVTLAVNAMLRAANAIYVRYPIAQGRPIKGYLQVVKLVVYIAAGMLIVAALMDQSPWIFLSGLGAMTAVLLLIFRETILSLVAGVQLIHNDLVRIGDWIQMPQFDADGDVIDIALSAVRVQNWDKTIAVIPTHKFLEHSFQNWRGMYEAGGRRIKRAFNIDMTTIRFLSEKEVGRLCRIHALRDYLEQKREEVEAYNSKYVGDDCADLMANGRHLTNIGTLRAYIAAYLRSHPKVRQDMTFLVRQLDPTPTGVPMEIYIFCTETRWADYEAVQADIFDFILAVVHEFDLRVFQSPSGSDLNRLISTAAETHDGQPASHGRPIEAGDEPASVTNRAAGQSES